MSKILTRQAFENAIRVNGAIGGSTNAVIHLLAIAGRIGVDLSLDDWDRLGQDVPCLVNLMPSGKYLMEDFYYAGGLPAVMRELGDLLHGDARHGVRQDGRREHRGAPSASTAMSSCRGDAVQAQGGIVVLRGNSGAERRGHQAIGGDAGADAARGRAVVFENIDHYKQRVDDPALDVDETCVLVLKNCGPKGYPGMAEVGNMALPQKVLKKGVRDMVRISDARMSGTAYGTVVLHTAPEAAIGGPLALVARRRHDRARCGQAAAASRRFRRRVGRRRKAWKAPEPSMATGYQRMYVDHVLQADRGCDMDFLVGKRGAAIPREFALRAQPKHACRLRLTTLINCMRNKP